MKRAYTYGLITLTTLLVSAWVFHFIYPLCYTIAINHTKSSQEHIISTGAESGSYITLAMSLTDFQRAYDPGEHELSYGDKMYDAADIQQRGDSVFCTVLYDHKETELQAGYTFQQKHTTTKSNTISLSFWCPVNCVTSKYTTPIVFITVLQPLFKTSHAILLDGYNTQPILPPELVLV